MGVLPWIPNIYVIVAIKGILGYCWGGQDVGNELKTKYEMYLYLLRCAFS